MDEHFDATDGIRVQPISGHDIRIVDDSLNTGSVQSRTRKVRLMRMRKAAHDYSDVVAHASRSVRGE